MVVVHLPPPLRSITPEFVTLNRNEQLLRIFDPTKYDATATSFRNYGSISRFDHHRDRLDKLDPERSVLYAGLTLSCCLVEIFGDGGIVNIKQQQLAFITLKEKLKLLDLRGSAAMAAGTVSALSSITERNISQAWGRYFYDNPQLYSEIDGLIFTGAHNGEDAVCLYERAKTKMASAKVEVLNLNHPDLRDTILSIAKNHSLIVNPYLKKNMKIEIVTVEKRIPEFTKPVSVVPQSTKVTLEEIFTEFLQLGVGDGAASTDTVRSYLSQTKQYLDWCKDNLLQPLEVEDEDIKLYRQYLVQTGYQNNTIATKLNIVRIFYKAALTHGLIKSNPAEKIKAPKDRKDPAARITFMEAEELKFLLDHIQSQLNEAKTNKQKLVLMRDRILIGIMSVEGCRTVEMHQLKIEDIVKQGLKTGLQVSAKRASRVVPLTENLATQLDGYLQMRQKVLRRKIKPADYVFVSLSNNSKGKQLSRRSIRAIVDGYLKAANLKHTPGRILSAHSLRHTAGTLALRTGSDLRQVQDLLGHADPRTTSIYAHVGDRWEYNPGAAVEKKMNEANPTS